MTLIIFKHSILPPLLSIYTVTNNSWITSRTYSVHKLYITDQQHNNTDKTSVTVNM